MHMSTKHSDTIKKLASLDVHNEKLKRADERIKNGSL